MYIRSFGQNNGTVGIRVGGSIQTMNVLYRLMTRISKRTTTNKQRKVRTQFSIIRSNLSIGNMKYEWQTILVSHPANVQLRAPSEHRFCAQLRITRCEKLDTGHCTNEMLSNLLNMKQTILLILKWNFLASNGNRTAMMLIEIHLIYRDS